ncbi:MAG TPA: hypothetical protein VGD69_14820 [Herpetosiphonaceae bacterium]
MEPNTIVCPHLEALLAQERAGTNTVALEDAIEQHLAACHICAACEQVLTQMIAAYRHVELPLNTDLERRLLDQLCRSRAGEDRSTHGHRVG